MSSYLELKYKATPESNQEMRYLLGRDKRPPEADRTHPDYVGPESRYVYFIEDVGFIKIGVGTRPKDRLSHLQTGNPRPLTLLGSYLAKKSEEASLHKRFLPHWIRGEWFRDNPELLELIALKCPAEPVAVAA
jgi:hypothetical protein